MTRGAIAVALLALIACEPRPSGTGATSTAATPSSPPPVKPAANPTNLRTRLIGAGYGGVGPQSLAPAPNLWIVLFVGIETTENLTGVALDQVELVDAAGKVVARAAQPFSLRRDTVKDDARRKWDFAEQGTVPFDGAAKPGEELRLRVHAPLDTRAEALRAAPVRFRARFHAAGDPGVWVEGSLQSPWPTG